MLSPGAAISKLDAIRLQACTSEWTAQPPLQVSLNRYLRLHSLCVQQLHTVDRVAPQAH